MMNPAEFLINEMRNALNSETLSKPFDSNITIALIGQSLEGDFNFKPILNSAPVNKEIETK